MTESLWTPQFLASMATNAALLAGNVIQAFRATDSARLRSSIEALTSENASLRRQLVDEQAARTAQEAGSVARVRDLESRLAAEQRIKLPIAEAEAERGEQTFDTAAMITFAAALAAAEKYEIGLEQLLNQAKDFVCHELGMKRADVDRIVDSESLDGLSKLVMDHGRAVGVLMLMKTAMHRAGEGLAYCAGVSTLYHHIFKVGIRDPYTPLRVAVRDFLEARPLFKIRNELGEIVDVFVTPADIDRNMAQLSRPPSDAAAR